MYNKIYSLILCDCLSRCKSNTFFRKTTKIVLFLFTDRKTLWLLSERNRLPVQEETGYGRIAIDLRSDRKSVPVRPQFENYLALYKKSLTLWKIFTTTENNYAKLKIIL